MTQKAASVQQQHLNYLRGTVTQAVSLQKRVAAAILFKTGVKRLLHQESGEVCEDKREQRVFCLLI